MAGGVGGERRGDDGGKTKFDGRKERRKEGILNLSS